MASSLQDNSSAPQSTESDNSSLLPLLPLKDIVVFPHMIVPVFIGESICIHAVEEALAGDKKIFLSAFQVACVSSEKLRCDQEPPFDVYNVGTICSIMRTRKLPDGRMKVLVQGLYKATLDELVSVNRFPLVRVHSQDLPRPSHQTSSSRSQTLNRKIEAMVRSVRENLEKIVNMGQLLSPDILLVIEDVKNPARLSDLIASNLGLKVQDAQEILCADSPLESLKAVNGYLSREIEVHQMQVRIQSQAKEEMGKMQREHYLREQIRVLKNELGDHDSKDELEELWQKLETVSLSEEAREEVVRHLKRLQRMHVDSSEAALSRTYVETMLSLPWGLESDDNLELRRVSEVLDEDHFGLEAVKERILEYLAVKKLNPGLRSPILCFVGPPGVGKTSLGRSVAKSMDRKFSRISLGGVKDDAEIRGHRKTYVGSYPGRIMSAIKKAGVMNPVIMLDEIDKVGHDHRGDPASALLEALDPAQNSAFQDHYLGVPFDISRVMFIANANSLDTIPHPLRDRLEIIEVNGYSFEEKVSIAKEFLVPKQILENGLANYKMNFTPAALQRVIQGYTRESGLRSLEKRIACICRKKARLLAESTEKENAKVEAGSADQRSHYAGKDTEPSSGDRRSEASVSPLRGREGLKNKEVRSSGVTSGGHARAKKITHQSKKIHSSPSLRITAAAVEQMLGAPMFGEEFYHFDASVGVALGMAYTYFGGEILAIEVNIMPAPAFKLVLTGQLGDVMKESAHAALSFLRSRQKQLGIAEGSFEKREFHIHVPAGAVSKDGPSAGIAITTALLSALLGRAPRARTCLSGELTLHGKVLAVGGLKEKLLAAQREGVEVAILPEKNRGTYDHLPAVVRRKTVVRFVSCYEEIFDYMFGGDSDCEKLPLSPHSSSHLPEKVAG